MRAAGAHAAGGADAATRERVLRAACELFAERGFRDVTVREICAAASANVAAVNYHFGDKAGLYHEVLEAAIAALQAITAEARRAGEGQPAAERLRRFVEVVLSRMPARLSAMWIHQLIQREMADPTSGLDAVVQRALRPRFEYLCGIVAELGGAAPTDGRVMRCAASIHVQFLLAMPNPIALRIRPPGKPADSLHAMADHLCAFSIGGIASVFGAARGPGHRPVTRS